MKIEGYVKPKSSFLSIEKDMNIIMQSLLENKRLQKLLYYNSPDALEREPLSKTEVASLVGKNIKNVPKLYVDKSVLTYIIVNFDTFTPNATNPEFRDNVIEFDIVCHFDQWSLKDFQLRPFRIAAEIDSMFNNKHLTGIGLTEFMGASQVILNDEFAGVCLMYRAVHGEEDKQQMPNPIDQESFEKDFKEECHLH